MRRSLHDPSYALIRKHLRSIRRRAGMTQFELSQKLGYLSHSEVSKIERGDRFPDILLYIRWCRACDENIVTSIIHLLEEGV